MKFVMYVMEPEPISTAYFKNPSIGLLSVARQWLSINVTAAKKTHATIEELLDASSTIRAVSYQTKRGH
jgi:hypothetical protein